MPKKSLELLTESMFYVLMALDMKPMCGIEIASFVEETTAKRLRIGPATLYTILAKFEQQKYIREIAAEGRKRTYAITPEGSGAYAAEVRRLKLCLADAMKTAEKEAEQWPKQ